MKVADAIGRALVDAGIEQVFGVVGSGNFHVTNALTASGATFVAARHEGGAVTMGDVYWRQSGRVAGVSLHTGCGLTNGLTGLTEAAKSGTPLLVIAGDTAASDTRSNFNVDQAGVIRSLGAVSESITSPGTAVREVARAYRRAAVDGETVVLNLPLDIQLAEWSVGAETRIALPNLPTAVPSPSAVSELAEMLGNARRPVFIAGRGALAPGGREYLQAAADACGALLATTAATRGLFADDPWDLDVAGGFSTPTTAELIRGADLVVAWGASLNAWTLRHGNLLGPDASLVQVDHDSRVLGAHTPIDHGLVGDVGATARALVEELSLKGTSLAGYRNENVLRKIEDGARWHDVPFEDESADTRIDPRTLTLALDDLLPSSRVTTIDVGNFSVFPFMLTTLENERSVSLPLGFCSVGLGLSAGIGAAVARPGCVVMAALGDGGFMMSCVELDTAVRLKLPLIVVVYNDSAYGAESLQFGPQGHAVNTVEFPETDIAAIARGFGCDAFAVRRREDLALVRKWLDSDRSRPLVIDAKVLSLASWVMEHVLDVH